MFWISFIALLISVFSFILTAYKYWIDYKENKLKLSVVFKKLFVSGKRNVFEINFVNKSKNPVSITKITLTDFSINKEFESYQNKVLLTETKFIRNVSSNLPIHLEAYGSEKSFIVFDLEQILKSYRLNIFTNKGILTFDKQEIKLKEQSLLNLREESINK